MILYAILTVSTVLVAGVLVYRDIQRSLAAAERERRLRNLRRHYQKTTNDMLR
jgi:hypothetical protein